MDPLSGNRFQVPVQITPDQSNVFKGINNSLGHALPSYSAGGNNFNPHMDSSIFQANPHSSVQNSSHTFLQSGADNRGNITGITRLDKSGKKGQRLVDLAKQCPAKWCKQATNNSITLPLYMWASVAELEASLSGRSHQLQEGELLGKLRHMKHTLEVCCLNSSSSDFAGYGWSIAKDYAFKVEEEVANGLANWTDMQAGLRTNTLVLSQMDCPRQSTKSAKTKESEKQVCTTFNKCTTVGKCDYEVSNPGRTCQRKHECSWCRQNLGQGNKHQERECRKKNENGD